MTTATRSERLYVRTDADEKARIELAASLANQKVSDFVRDAVEDRAEKILAERHRTLLNEADFEALAEALDSPVTPNSALQEAVRRPRRFIQEQD